MLYFIQDLKLRGKLKYFIIAAVGVVIAIGAGIAILVLHNNGNLTKPATNSRLPTEIASVKLEDEPHYKSIADKAVSAYQTALKKTALDKATEKQVRHEAVYNDIYNTKSKQMMMNTKVSDKEAEALVKTGNYDKMVSIITVQPEANPKDKKANLKPYKVKLYSSDSASMAKVGAKYGNGKITAVGTPTGKDMLEDAREYLVCLQVVKQIETATDAYLKDWGF